MWAARRLDGPATAALVAIGTSRHRVLARLRFGLVFLGVVTLHALWDGTATGDGHLVIGGLSLALLLLVTWRLDHGHNHRPTALSDHRTYRR